MKIDPARIPVRWATLLAAGVLVLAGLWAYRGTFAAPFFFDDQWSIIENPTIRHWQAIGQVLSPPGEMGAAVAGRPIVNLSLAANYAWGGLNVQGYHAANLAIHLLAGLTLFGIARRTLPHRGTGLAFALALLWTLHPLQTESVTFVIQRTESLMGLFYLLTLYGFIRSVEADEETKRGRVPRPIRIGRGTRPRFATVWSILSILACLLGMATKEVMVSAPLLVLLYDRTFVSGSFRNAWLRRRPYYLGLAATWLVLIFLVVRAGGHRSTAAGFGVGVSGWTYLLTQCRAILLYLKLAVWPHPLVVDYGREVVTHLGEVLPQALVIAALLAGTVSAVLRPASRPEGSLPRDDSRLRQGFGGQVGGRALGFAGVWFFAILAPSSSVVPLVTQTMAEHRMYLPLAAVIALGVCGGACALERLGAASPGGERLYLAFLFALSAALGIMTARRNEDYRSTLAIWSDTVAQRPGNARAHNNLGNVLIQMPGGLNDAMAQYHEALRLNPDFADAHSNLGNAWSKIPGHMNDAIREYQEAVRLEPALIDAHYNLGNAWLAVPGRLPDAIAQYQETLRLKPDLAEAHGNLGTAWSKMPGRLPDAIAEYQAALALRPDTAETHFNLGNAWSDTPGRLNDAIAEYQEALRYQPNLAVAHYKLGVLRSKMPGRLKEATAQIETAVRLQPDLAVAWRDLGVCRYNLGDLPGAAAAFRQALRLTPDDPVARQDLAEVLRRSSAR